MTSILKMLCESILLQAVMKKGLVVGLALECNGSFGADHNVERGADIYFLLIKTDGDTIATVQ